MDEIKEMLKVLLEAQQGINTRLEAIEMRLCKLESEMKRIKDSIDTLF